jgi:hypothetical protein
MRSYEEVAGRAAASKVSIVTKQKVMLEMLDHMAKSDAGMCRKINHERYETMQTQVESLRAAIEYEMPILASMRWVLELTDDVDLTNLELDLGRDDITG